MDLPLSDDLAPRYRVDLSRLPAEVAARFIALEPDESVRRFVEQAHARRAGTLATRLHRWLGRFMSDFDVNGLLDIYPMQLLSSEQFRRILPPGPRTTLLDVGAGSGDVTAALGPLFERVLAFETSRLMRRRLERRGIAARSHDLVRAPTEEGPFDAIACLNVLDRCARPRRLLTHAVRALAPNGLLIAALALPYAPFYYEGGRTLDPEEPLAVSNAGWEDAFGTLISREILPLGLDLVAWTRAPYLSGGDARQPLYVLDDAVAVLARSA